MARAHLFTLVVVGTCLAALPTPATANGNVSHQWVTHAAIEATPAGGSLHALVSDPSLARMLDTGTMYPDWGYTPGATTEEREAGEASHWEPVQDAYRQWIVATYSPPWSDEARQHLAFYLGMSSHGIADQSYDSMFFERSRFYEPGDHSEFDQDTDVLWAATTGPGQAPTAWIPVDPLLALFEGVVGVAIDEASMEMQVGYVGIAIAAVGAIASDPAQVADAEADFPWAAAHDDDPLAPGNPPHEAEIARRYWRSNWALVHGEPVPRPVLWTHPIDGGSEHATDAASIESWVSVVFARALVGPEVDPSFFHLADATGAEVPIELDLFYGDGSHVVHLEPTEDLAADEVYVVTIDPGLPTIHGEALEGWSFTFSTGARAPDPLHDDAFWDEPDPYGDAPPDETTGGADETGSGSEATGAGASGSETIDDPGGSSESDTGSAAIDDAETTGCGCTHGHGIGGSAGLLLVVSMGRRRSRRGSLPSTRTPTQPQEPQSQQ